MNLMAKVFAKQCAKNLVEAMEPVQNLKFVDVILDSVEKNAMKLDVQVCDIFEFVFSWKSVGSSQLIKKLC